MKGLNLTTLILAIVGGINWGLVGFFEFNLVAAIFGAGTAIERLIYIIVGLSALWQIVPLVKAFQITEPLAESGYAARGHETRADVHRDTDVHRNTRGPTR